MTNLQYDEPASVAMLAGVPPRLRVLFALLAAIRILPTYGRFHAKTGRGDPVALRALSERLWRDVNGERMTDEEARAAADSALRLVPSEEDGWDEETQAYAEDAAAAVAYALRARVTEEPLEAAYAARRVYEAADHYAIAASGLPPDGFQHEQALLSHPVVQAELARQHQDLKDIGRLAQSSASASEFLALRRRSEQAAHTFFQEAAGESA